LRLPIIGGVLNDLGALASIGAFVILAAGLLYQPLRSWRRSKALQHLADVHDRGIALRNVAIDQVTNDVQLKAFMRERDEDWYPEAEAAVRRVNRNEAQTFQTIGDISTDVLEMPGYFSAEHARQVAFLTKWCRRMEDIHRRHSS